MKQPRLPKEEIEGLIEEYKKEEDPFRRQELNFRLVLEQVKEIEEAYERYNDRAERRTIDAAVAFLSGESKEPKFEYWIAPSSYKGDWSS